MSAGAARECLYLVDAHSLIFQVFHAIKGMTSPSGLPTNALFGFARDLAFLRHEKRPDYLVCAFDVAGRTLREKIYPEYKAHRAPMPDDLVVQLPLIDRLLEALRVPRLGVTGYEADDVIATVAKAAAARGLDVFICTSDKDCRQLIDDHVRMYNLRKRQELGRRELLEDWGVTPEQVVDLQALTGDSVDNVPGVPGIGVKTAAKLLQEFGTLENLLANVDKVAGAKRQENLRAARDVVSLSRPLVQLATDVPLTLDWDAWRLQEPDVPALLALYQEVGFRGMADALRNAAGAAPPAAGSVQGELFPFGANVDAGAAAPAADGQGGAPWEATYHLVDTPAKFRDFLKQLRKRKRFAVDLETTGLDPLRSEIIGLSFSWQAGEAWYLAVRGPEGDAVLDPAPTLDQLRPVLEDAAVAKVNQNIKYDLLALRRHGVALAGVRGDSMVADYLLHAGERSHNLEELARRYLNHQVIVITELIGKKGKNQLRLDQVSTARVAEYSGEDADVAWRLCERLEPELRTQELGKLYDDLEVPLIEVLAELEYNGIRLDVPLLRRLGEEMTQQLAGIEREIHELAGHPFNIASLKQLRQVLFDEMKLPIQRRTGITGEPSTDQETLEKLAGLGHPLPKKIVDHRQLAKLKGTYVDTLPDLVNPDTGRIHASFNQTVVETGRLSCLPAGTLVNTQRGLVGIESVRPGDLVRTPYGPRRVLAWQATGEKPVVALDLSNGITLRCSLDHKLRSRGGWVEARALAVGAPVYLSFVGGLFGRQTKLRLHYSGAYRTRKTPVLPDRWTVDLAELVGYLMADGHLARSNYNEKPAKVILAFDWDADELREHLASILRRVFGKEPVRRLTRTCPVLELSGVDVAGAFVQLGAGGKSGEIRVPPSLFRAPAAVVGAFLRGYFEGDGCVGEDAGIQVRSVSRAMLKDVQQLLTLFGIPSSLGGGSPDPRGYAPRYRLLVLGDRSKRVFRDRVGFLSSKKRAALDHLVEIPREKSAAEVLTLPEGLDSSAVKTAVYDFYRGPNGRVPQAVMVFACKLARRAKGVTLARAEWLVKAYPDAARWEARDFFQEAVAAQYYEVRVAAVAQEAAVPTYDIAVEEVEQYLAQGVVVHNSSDPNLQNIPSRREQGRQVRQAFLPEAGWQLLTADYSQIELRLLAHFSGDEALRRAFAEDRDIHTLVAAQIYGVPEADVTAEMRWVAKKVNFGVIYGMSPPGLAQQLSIPRQEAAKFIDAYFARYPKVLVYQARLLENCRRTGYVGTILGRRRWIQGVRPDSTYQGRNQPERQAVNMEIQGSAADLIKLAMLRIHERLRKERRRARMLLQIHDELVFEVPPDELDAVTALVREEMTTPRARELGLRVPLEVDLGVGPNWLDVEEV